MWIACFYGRAGVEYTSEGSCWRFLPELITKPASNNGTEEALLGWAQLAGRFVTASKPPPAVIKKGACVRVWLHICQPGGKQACLSAFTWFRCVVPRHFWQGQIKKSVRVCWSSKQSAVGTLHWGSVNHFRDSRDEMRHLKDLCSVTLLRWQLPNHVSQATLKVDQIMAFCAIHHSVFSTDMRKFVPSIGYRPLVNNFKIPQYSSTLTGVHEKVSQMFLSWFWTLPIQEGQKPHYFLFLWDHPVVPDNQKHETCLIFMPFTCVKADDSRVTALL